MNGSCRGSDLEAAVEPGPGWRRNREASSAALGAETGERSPREEGRETIPLGLARAAAGPMLAAFLPGPETGWPGFEAAAARLVPLVALDRALWERGCRVLGRRRAALALLLLEQGLARELEGTGLRPVAVPGAYFRALVERGREGRLDLAGALHALAARAR